MFVLFILHALTQQHRYIFFDYLQKREKIFIKILVKHREKQNVNLNQMK